MTTKIADKLSQTLSAYDRTQDTPSCKMARAPHANYERSPLPTKCHQKCLLFKNSFLYEYWYLDSKI
jgi:hypothetical protein